MANIFEYFDYRKYLRDIYEQKKAQNPSFSYRYIAHRVGINASTFVRILQGQRNITPKVFERIVHTFKLGKKEADYFEILVLFCQSKTQQQKKLYFEKILVFRKAKTTLLVAAQYKVFEKWYYIAIRELLNHVSFKDNYEELARMLKPAIKPKEVKDSIQLLEQLGLIKRDKRGYYRPTHQFVSAGEDWESIAVGNFQESTIKLAGEAIERFSANEREISSITAGLSQKGLEIVKEKIRQLRKDILEVENQEKKVDEVFQFNFQVFPLSNMTKGNHGTVEED